MGSRNVTDTGPSSVSMATSKKSGMRWKVVQSSSGSVTSMRGSNWL